MRKMKPHPIHSFLDAHDANSTGGVAVFDTGMICHRTVVSEEFYLQHLRGGAGSLMKSRSTKALIACSSVVCSEPPCLVFRLL